jgi:hypothetical protein
MIRLIHCINALPELSAAEFRRHFRGRELAALVDQIATLSEAVEYKLSLTLQVEANLELMQERGGAEPFDALIEVWWHNGQDLARLVHSEEFHRLNEKLREHQRQFVDFSRSSRFFVEE